MEQESPWPNQFEIRLGFPNAEPESRESHAVGEYLPD